MFLNRINKIPSLKHMTTCIFLANKNTNFPLTKYIKYVILKKNPSQTNHWQSIELTQTNNPTQCEFSN